MFTFLSIKPEITEILVKLKNMFNSENKKLINYYSNEYNASSDIKSLIDNAVSGKKPDDNLSVKYQTTNKELFQKVRRRLQPDYYYGIYHPLGRDIIVLHYSDWLLKK